MKLKHIALAIAAISTSVAQAATYEYIGSFTTNGSSVFSVAGGASSAPAPYWGTNPPVYSALDAAALLFGGIAGNYAISTVSSDIASINHMGWYDGWGDHGGRQFAESYKLDLSGLGYNGCESTGINCYNSAYSAYISDGFSATNYVFRVAAVPEPDTIAMLMAGLGLMGAVARRRRKEDASA